MGDRDTRAARLTGCPPLQRAIDFFASLGRALAAKRQYRWAVKDMGQHKGPFAVEFPRGWQVFVAERPERGVGSPQRSMPLTISEAASRAELP